MAIIRWYANLGFVGGERTGEFLIDEDETEEEIDQLVIADISNYLDYGWEKIEERD